MLPPLPKQKKKREADFGVEFRHWLEQNGWPDDDCSFELKHTRGAPALLFSEVKGEQVVFGNMIESATGVLIRVIGLRGEPDYVFMRNTPAYVVIRYPMGVCAIRMTDWQKEKATSKVKSLSWERAMEIGVKLR